MPEVTLAERPDLDDRTAARVARFFGHHAALVGVDDAPELDEAREALAEWRAEDHALYVVEADGEDVGFVHLWFKGPIVVWIEDLWIDEERRGQGLGGAAIAAVEHLVAARFPHVEAVSMDVAPRNEAAMRLYHRLGYDAMSMVTLRKQVRGEDPRQESTTLLGRTFRY